MEYNVFYHEINGDKIKTFNVLRKDGIIYEFLKELRMRDMNRDEFEEELRRELRYYYWAKCEAEVLISAWVGGDAEEKIDIYQQIDINWKLFSDICWNFYMGKVM